MSLRASILRGTAAIVLGAAAVALVLLARDGWHWCRAFRDGDARADVRPVGVEYLGDRSGASGRLGQGDPRHRR